MHRIARRAAALAALCLAAACGDEDPTGTIPIPEPPVVGTYVLFEIANKPVPAELNVNPEGVRSGLDSGSIVMDADSSFHYSEAVRTTPPTGQASVARNQWNGTYSIANKVVTFTFPPNTFTHQSAPVARVLTLSGGVLTGSSLGFASGTQAKYRRQN